METAAKIWEATTNDGEITITPIIEFLNNIKFLASAYNQMWVIKKMNLTPSIPKRSIGCAYLKNAPLSYAAKAFINLIV